MKKAIVGLTVLVSSMLLLSKWLGNQGPVCPKHQIAKVGATDFYGRRVYRCAQCEIEHAFGVD